MKRLPIVLLVSGLLLAALSVASTEPEFAFPDTPSGLAARAYFGMVADGSDAAIRAFEQAYRGSKALAETPMEQRVQRTQDLKFRFGDLRPTAILDSSAEGIRVAASGAKVGELEFEFVMDPSEPQKLRGISVTINGGDQAVSQPLTPERRAAVVEGAARVIAGSYVYPDRGKAMAERIRQAAASGGFDAVTDERVLARRLTEEMRAVTHDLHLSVNLAPGDPKKTPENQGPHGDPGRDNYAFKKVELVDGNIAVIRFDGFLEEPGALKVADAAMAFAGHADAVVFDIRQNGGGSPVMIRRLTSYFLPVHTHLNSMVDRNGKVVEDYWTVEVKGRFRQDLPVYVVTSAGTFSAAEEFTYDLKNLKRATIVGETTGGGAHPVRPVRVDDRFVVNVPFLRALNPVTKTNWEGVGVEPDVKASADQALNKALELARAVVRKGH
jgi:hypothetical protein